MIVKMCHLDVLCVAAEKEAMLERLRALGALHLDLRAAASDELSSLRGEAAEAETAVRLIAKARETSAAAERRAVSVADVLALAAEHEKVAAAAEETARLVQEYAPYGDFDPALAQKLLAAGIDVRSVAALPATLPPRRLSALEGDLSRTRARLAELSARLAACDEQAILAQFPALADRMAFAAARALLAQDGAVARVAGWMPEKCVAAVKAEAKAAGWGLLVRAPAPEETPPTLVEPPKFFRPVKVLFDGLGIAPAYTEADVSVPFMCYFSLFFAMLVGDGAYGAIFLAATLALRRKLPRSWFVLLCLFSSATIGWGVLSNTWFGAGLPWCAAWPTVTWLADPSYSNMMLLCFTIGASHLILARVWNGLCKLNDLTALAEFGWAGVLLFMYFVTNAIVGIFPAIPSALYWVFGLSLVLVFGFSVKPSEFKTRGAELGMLPLSMMGALGDIISYVRLFAVGLASVKVAENFNAMALDLFAGAQSVWLKALLAVAMVAILVVGHGLNLAMAGLSVLVHAVRLNTLEFSNHKGVSWSGYAFEPFRKKSLDDSSKKEEKDE